MLQTHFLSTEYDEATPYLDVPVKLTDGQTRSIKLADFVSRGGRVIGRITAPSAILGLKIRARNRALRVSVQLRSDWHALRAWADFAGAGASRRELPRLVVVRSQGRVRAAAVLARGHNVFGTSDVRAVLTFDIDPDEMSDDGWLLIELTDAGRGLPPWAAQSFLANAAVGLQIDWIEVTATAVEGPPNRVDGAGCELQALASAGGLARGNGTSAGPARLGFVVVNPRATTRPVRLQLRAGRTLSNRGARVPGQTRWSKSAAGVKLSKGHRMLYGYMEGALARLGLRRPRFFPGGLGGLSVASVRVPDGSPVPVQESKGRLGRLTLSFESVLDGPVLVGLDTAPVRRARYRGAVVCRLLGARWI